MTWTAELESRALELKAGGATYAAVAKALGKTLSSVKHKIRRLQQRSNDDRYKHTKEKTEISTSYLTGTNLNILETHCGFGAMTEVYAKHGSVTGFDIVQERVDSVNALGLSNVMAIKQDSELAIYDLISQRKKYDVIDLDPYGFPSRFFPHVFNLIDDGYLVVTFPMMGVAQINKITIGHYRAFWGIELEDKDSYLDKITNRMTDYAFMCKRAVEVVRIDKVDRIYRIVLKVKRESLCKIVGLEIDRATNEHR